MSKSGQRFQGWAASAVHGAIMAIDTSIYEALMNLMQEKIEQMRSMEAYEKNLAG